MNGANVVLIYPRPVISGLSQCRLPPFKNTVFVPIQSVLTKKPGDYRLRYIKTILSFQNSVTYGEVTTRDCLVWGNIRIQSFQATKCFLFYIDCIRQNFITFFTIFIEHKPLKIPFFVKKNIRKDDNFLDLNGIIGDIADVTITIGVYSEFRYDKKLLNKISPIWG